MSKYKYQYKKRTGKKTAHGFKGSPEYVRERRAEYMREYRSDEATKARIQKRENERLQMVRDLEKSSKREDEDENFTEVLSDDEIFFNSLSYGNRNDEAIEDAFKEGKKSGKDVVALIVDENGNEKRITSYRNFDAEMKKMFKRYQEEHTEAEDKGIKVYRRVSAEITHTPLGDFITVQIE